MTKPVPSSLSVLIVEPQGGGHTLTNYSALLESPSWREDVRDKGVSVSVLCPQRLAAGIARRMKGSASPGIFLTGFSPDSAKWNRGQTVRALFRAVKQQGYNRIFFAYLDDLLLFIPIIKLLLPGVHLSGLYMRPMAHFRTFGYPSTGKVHSRWFVAVMKNRLLLAFLKLGLLRSCVFQDEGAVKYFNKKTGKALWMPTPLSHTGDLHKTDSGRFRYTLFGEISARKGLFRICDAWKQLPASLKGGVELRLVGNPLSSEESAIRAAVQELRNGGWQVFCDFRFVGHEEIPGIHADTDVLLLPYRNHFGTSGVLIQALYWRVPVIVDDFGWPAYTMSSLRAGVTVNTSNAGSFAGAIASMMDRHEAGHDFRRYTERNHSRNRYGREVVDILLRNKSSFPE